MTRLRISVAALGAFWTVALLAGSGWAGVAVDGLVHERTAQPGEAYRGTIIVRNTGDASRRARVYQTDYLFFSDGRNVYGAAGVDERSNAGWLTLSTDYLELPPNGSVPVEYVAAVPPDGSLRGSYWSLVMIEELPADARGSGRDGVPAGSMQSTVRQALRYGVHLVTHVGDTGSREIRFADKALVETEDGARTLYVDVENTGERTLRPHLWLELHDSSGGRPGRFETGPKRLYPGTSVRYAVDLTEAASGSYQALVVIDNGDEHVFGAQYGVTF